MKRFFMLFFLLTSLIWAHDVGPKSIDKVLTSHKVVVVKFWASWCIPCSILKPDYVAAKSQLQRKVYFAEYNVDLGGASRYGVSTIPALILFKNGKLVDRQEGVLSKEAIVDWIRENLKN